MPREYDAWLEFIFNPPSTEPKFWFWDGDYEQAIVPAAQVCLVHVCRLFQSSAGLLTTYTPKRIDEGLWRIVHFLDDWLDSPALALALRLEVIGWMPTLFRDSLGRVTCKTCYTSYMWWDCLRSLTGGFHRTKTPELLPAMREAMLAMLRSDNASEVASAVHGLGHLVADRADQPARAALLALRKTNGHAMDAELRDQLDRAIAGTTH